MTLIAETWSTRDRSERAVKLYDTCERHFREAVSMIHKQEDLVEFCINKIPQTALMMKVQDKYDALTWSEKEKYDDRVPRLLIRENPDDMTVELVFHNLPYELMIQHFAGPIHRMYNCLWRFTVGSERFTLTADVMVRDYGRPIDLDLDCYLDNAEKCTIIEDKESQSWINHTYRVKCS